MRMSLGRVLRTNVSAEDTRLTGEDDGKRCRNHHLIVIDNGFDLSCGLASSFKDFFEPRMKVIDSLVSEEGACDYETIKARGLTAWDLILRSRKDMESKAFNVNWCDVETAIANVFGINLPEGGIDDEGIVISDNAVSFGTLLDYTFPYRWLKRRFGDADLVIIHGTLDGECIFGIDGSGNLDDRDIPPFTKTYRVLKAARGVPSGSIAYPAQRGGDGLKTSSRIYFGHSLSRTDYSYFESIFSTVDLYNGHTSLVFLYSNYAKGVRESEVAKVLALLDYYGTSLGVAERSNNLAHKLMLEGRLVVREI